MTHNDLKQGDRVRAMGLFGLGPRYATVSDNRKGIRRMLKIDESNGHYPDMGDVFVDEIVHVLNVETGEWDRLTLAPGHAKQMRAIRAAGF